MTNYTFQSLIDFTRTTSGTFVGSDGLIQLTPASVNVLLQTQQFDNASWAKTNSTVTANTTVAPDGTSTADKLVEDTATSNHQASQSPSVTTARHTFSLYAKAAERSWIRVVCVDGGAYINLTNGTVGGVAAGTVLFSASTPVNVGNGWYRIEVGFTPVSAGAASCTVRLATGDGVQSYLGDGTSGIFVWGAQLEAASAATTYTRNNGGVYPPRFDYDPVTLAPKGILLEEQRTNLLLNSVFGGAISGTPGTVPTSWTYGATGGTLTVTDLGRNFASNSLRFTVTSNRQTLQQNVTLAATGTYVLSASVNVFVSTSVQQMFQFNPLPAGATIQYVYNGVNQIGGFAPPTGTGLLQVIITTTGTGGSLGIRVGVGTSGVTTGDVSFQDIQIELGLFATSYIPTAGSTVTRAADVCSIVAPMFAPWYNQSEGTFVVEASTLSAGNVYRSVASARASGGITDAINLAIGMGVGGAAGIFRDDVVVGGVTQAPLGDVAAFAANTPYKNALAYKANDFASATSGENLRTDTSGTVPTVALLDIGNRNSLSYTNGHIRSIRYYPVRLSDTQIQALTA